MKSLRHAIITGGSSGIGAAVALQLARQGAAVSLVARTPEKLAHTQSQIEMQTRGAATVLTVPADVADRQQAEAAVERAIATLGPPDLLLTCAGMAECDYFNNLSIEQYERAMAVNYFGSLYCLKAALPVMEQQRQGHIVLVSSGVGLMGIYGYSAYSPTKFALRGLAESLRGELKVLGLRISVVYPPDADTPQLIQENQTKPPETRAISSTAALWTAEDVATAIVAGVRQSKFMITPGLEMTILGRFHSLIAPALNGYFDRLVQQIRSR